MRKRTWIMGGLVLVAAVVVALSILPRGGQEYPATIVEVVNKVDAHPRPKEDWLPAAVDMAIYGGGQVRTGAASSAKMILMEGSVRLSPDSIFTVKQSTSRQDTPVTTLFLQEGRLWVHLAPDQPHEFTVETGSAAAAVRDTDFSVQVADGATLLSVAKGKVELTAQEQSVTVRALQQATVETGQPPALPRPMSEEERKLWATEGEMPGLAPGEMLLDADVSCRLTGVGADLASRNPETVFDAAVRSPDAARVVVTMPGGDELVLDQYGDLFGTEPRFFGYTQGIPRAGGTYLFTALDAGGTPIPGAATSDVYVGGNELDSPTNLRAEVVEAGVLVRWDPPPEIPGAFEPSGSPHRGFYQISLTEGRMEYGWNHVDRPLIETSHLIPLRRQDFGPGDRGMALEELDDDVYYVMLTAFSLAPEGSAGHGNECSVGVEETIPIIVEGGRVRVGEP